MNAMKTWRKLVLFAALTVAPVRAQTPEPLMVRDPSWPWWAHGPWVTKPVPLFYSVVAETHGVVKADRVEIETELRVKILQGSVEKIELEIHGDGEVSGVEGDGVAGWAVRREADGKRFLEIRVAADGVADERLWKVKGFTPVDEQGYAEILHPGAGGAVGFEGGLRLSKDGAVYRVMVQEGLKSLVEEAGQARWAGEGRLQVRVGWTADQERAWELRGSQLRMEWKDQGSSVEVRLSGILQVRRAGEALPLAEGLALKGEGVADGWHVGVEKRDGRYRHLLIGDQPGEYPVEWMWEAPVAVRGDGRAVAFRVEGGVVVPLEMSGWDQGWRFDPAGTVLPEWRDHRWQANLPASGEIRLGWTRKADEDTGALFYSTNEITDLTISQGLASQVSTLSYRILQGELREARLWVDGEGELLQVEGEGVVGWKLEEVEGRRQLVMTLNREMAGDGGLKIHAQQPLGAFPVGWEGLRLSPVGSLRHQGVVRVVVSGAVKVEVESNAGMLQVPVGVFPGGVPEGARQVMVYRFPAAERSLKLRADVVTPEVSVQEVTLHEMAESDRRMNVRIELEVREAPLRDWEIEIPGDFAVAGVEGKVLADYRLEQEGDTGGRRKLRMVFAEPLKGRYLLDLRLEKNQAAAAGEWVLPQVVFPGVKSHRGFVAVEMAAGYRVVPVSLEGLVELPVDGFPGKRERVQLAYRMRGGEWLAKLRVEALGQSIQADVFHLYSLKEGAVSGSILINYFVVGSPAVQWQLRVPESFGNLEVSGQHVGRDWKREADVLTIPLSRPLMGAGTLLLTFEQPMSARGGALAPGEVRPMGIQSERGYVQVVSPVQVRHEVMKAEGSLLSLQANELPAEYRLLSSAPTLGAWQYTSGDFQLGLEIKWHEPGQVVEQVVDRGELESRVSRDGQVVTDAVFYLKSRGRTVLGLRLPGGAELWEVKVAGQAVNARMDGTETLIPLEVAKNPDEAVEVRVRYGLKSKSESRVELMAPVMHAPMVLGWWRVSGDTQRVLLPRGGDLEAMGSRKVVSGLERMSGEAGMWLLVVLAFLAVGWRFFDGSRWKWFGTTLMGMALVGILVLGWWLWQVRMEAPSVPSGVLEYAMPVVGAGQLLKVKIANLSPWAADVSWWGMAMVAAGVGMMILKVRPRGISLQSLALALIFWGVLMNPMGEMILVSLIGVLMAVLLFRGWSNLLRPSGTVVGLAMGGLLLVGAERSYAQWEPMESMSHQWHVGDGRLRGEVEFRARGDVGESYLLLKSPAVLTSFEGEGWKLVKRTEGEEQVYLLVADQAGVKRGKAMWEMPLAGLEAWKVPTGVAAVQRATARWPEAGWVFQSEQAASVREIAGEGSCAELWFYPSDEMVVRVAPRQRDVAQEEVKFFAELSDLYLPGSGGVSGRHRVEVRPSQGLVRELNLTVGQGMTVTEVSKGPVGRWRFNPETKELKILLDPGQKEPFVVEFLTQSGDATLPVDLVLGATRVSGAEGVVGRFGLAFGAEAQAEKVEVSGLSEGNLEDFPEDLMPVDAEGKALGVLNRSYRHLGDEVGLSVRVVAVEPELRMMQQSLLTLGEDRTVWATDLEVAVSRAGVFRLGLDVPDGFEVEAVSGEGVAEWTESKQNGQRVVTLHLTGRTMGTVKVALSLAGPGVGATQGWKVPEVRLRGAVRQSGTLTVLPERGMQVRVVSRQRVSQMDAGEALKMQPGALAFRMLEAGSELVLGVSRLDPWVSAQVLHEVTLREGQNLSRVRWLLKVENSAIKVLQLSLPGLDEATAATLRATGPAVSDLVPVEGQAGKWELKFQRGVIGETTVDLEYQMQTDRAEMTMLPSSIDQVRQMSYFMALRSGGRLELERPETARGWQKVDWAVVAEGLRQWSDGGMPAYVYRVAEVEGPLKLSVKRHQLADSSLRRVQSGELTTLVSPDGGSVTKVDLAMQVTEKGLLRLDLPDGADLYSVVVNDEGVSLVKEGREWLFYVHPALGGDQPAAVRIVYTVPAGGAGIIEGPRLNVPLENLHWNVIVPEGWELAGYDGDFNREGELRHVAAMDYRSWVEAKRREGKIEAQALLDQANLWMAEGDQLRAGQAFSNAARNGLLDDASNEDAQVQLRNLKTQQATLALNTRRQRMYLWNRASMNEDNKQLEEAAMDNPLLQGRLNFDPSKYEQLLEGNSADEASAMKEIARRIVAQQLAADPAPTAMEVSLAESGTVVRFSRSVQVEGGAPMRIELKLKPQSREDRRWGWVVGALAAVSAGWMFRRGRVSF